MYLYMRDDSHTQCFAFQFFIGTGKTTIAKLFGRILVELGYLTNGEVIVVGASKLVGGVSSLYVYKYVM
jgi:hypothetical protein